MENELKIKYEKLLNWLEPYQRGFYLMLNNKPFKRGCILMNNDITGFIASRIFQEVFGKENTLNVIIPCYSNLEYLTKSAHFSRNCGVESKNIGLKQVYDDIIELDYGQSEFTDVGDKIKDYLRDQVIDVICKKNDSVKFGFKTMGNDYYLYLGDITEASNTFSYDDINELAKYFEINV